MNDQHASGDDLFLPAPLDAAVRAVLAEPLPADALARVEQRARQLAQAPSAPQSASVELRRPSPGQSRALFGTLAVAAALVLLVTAALLLPSPASPRAFAQVLDKVRDARTVHFKTTTQLGAAREIKGRMYLAGANIRLEQFDGRLVNLADLDSRRALFLDMRRKLSQTAEVDTNVARLFANPVDQLRNVKPRDAEAIGAEILRGRRVQVYRLRQPDLFGISGDCEMTVWVDAESELPAKIEIRSTDLRSPAFVRFDEFVWNTPLDRKLFSLDIPPGFQPGVVVTVPGASAPRRPDAAPPVFADGVLHDRVPATILWGPGGTTLTALLRDPESVPPLERAAHELRQWDLESGKLRWSHQVAGANWVSASADGKLLATVIGREVQLRDATTGAIVRKWATDQPLSPLAFSPDGATLAAGITQWGPFGGSGEKVSGGVQLWRLERGQLVQSFTDEKPVTFLTFSPDGKYLATSANDGPVKLWDLTTGEVARLFPGRVRAAFAPDGTLACIVASSTNKLVGTVERYQLRDASLVQTLSSEPGTSPSWLLGLDVSADGRLLAASDWNSMVTVWNLASGERQRTFTDHAGGVVSVAFSPDGATLATGSEDQTLRLWKLESD